MLQSLFSTNRKCHFQIHKIQQENFMPYITGIDLITPHHLSACVDFDVPLNLPETRLPSQFIGPSMKANAEHIENKHEPKDTRLIVLIPAGRSADLLSNPIRPPNSVAKMIRRPNDTSSGVRYNKYIVRVR